MKISQLEKNKLYKADTNLLEIDNNGIVFLTGENALPSWDRLREMEFTEVNV